MANQLATAATHGGVISRAINNGKRFIGGRSISSTSSSHVILDKLSATKILQCAFAGKIQPPPRPERIDADADELCMTADCDYYGYACQKLGEDGAIDRYVSKGTAWRHHTRAPAFDLARGHQTSASAAALVATRVRHLLSLIARVLAHRLPHWRPLRSSSLPPAVLVVAHPEEGEEAARLSHFPPSPVCALLACRSRSPSRAFVFRPARVSRGRQLATGLIRNGARTSSLAPTSSAAEHAVSEEELDVIDPRLQAQGPPCDVEGARW